MTESLLLKTIVETGILRIDPELPTPNSEAFPERYPIPLVRKYFRKPIVEAVQFVGVNYKWIEDWCGDGMFQTFGNFDKKGEFIVETGILRVRFDKQAIVNLSDWIVCYGKNSFGDEYGILKAEHFNESYQEYSDGR